MKINDEELEQVIGGVNISPDRMIDPEKGKTSFPKKKCTNLACSHFEEIIETYATKCEYCGKTLYE